MKTLILATALAGLMGSSAIAQLVPLAPNDVSILMPLPKNTKDAKAHLFLGQEPGLWPHELGATIMDKLFSTPPGPSTSLSSSMLVTAFRYDPCFPQLNYENPQNCSPQVRLTAQFYALSDLGSAVREEVALHLFYKLTVDEARNLVKDLRQLKAESPVSTAGQPLFVHPALAEKGMNSEWGLKLRSLILKYASTKNFFRLTGTGFVFDSWPFFAYKVNNGQLEVEPLAHVEEATDVQSWDIFAEPPYLGNIRPFSTAETGAKFFASVQNLKNESEIQAAMDSVSKIQNPLKHNPESVDCVSCHISQIAKADAIQQKGLKWNSPFQYQAPQGYNAKNLTDSRIQGATANVVQFGYFLRVSFNHGLPDGVPLPSVSDRVINESIEVARFIDSLEAQKPAPPSVIPSEPTVTPQNPPAKPSVDVKKKKK